MKLIGTKSVYKSKWAEIRREIFVLPKNKTIDHDTLYTGPNKDYVGIIGLEKGNKIILVKQYRYGIKEFLYEIAQGDVERDEKILDAAKREFEEETGYKAKTYKRIGILYPLPSRYNKQGHFFIAEGLSKGKQKFDNDETIKAEVVDFKKALRMIKGGKIKDCATIAVILMAKEFLVKSL